MPLLGSQPSTEVLGRHSSLAFREQQFSHLSALWGKMRRLIRAWGHLVASFITAYYGNHRQTWLSSLGRMRPKPDPNSPPSPRCLQRARAREGKPAFLRLRLRSCQPLKQRPVAVLECCFTCRPFSYFSFPSRQRFATSLRIQLQLRFS